MENIHMMVTGRIRKNGVIKRRVHTIITSKRQAMIELKQLINSLERAGIVHEIEDRESEFNGMQIDYIMLARPIKEDDDGNEIPDPADDYDEIEHDIEDDDRDDLEDDDGIPFM